MASMAQWLAVTATPTGSDKTVTVTNCFSIRRYFIILKTNGGKQKLSL